MDLDQHEYDLLCRVYDRYLVLINQLKKGPVDPRDYREKDEDDAILEELKAIVEI
jgi:hypothetical protein